MKGTPMKAKWGKFLFAIVLTVALMLTSDSLLTAQPKDSGKVYRVAILPFQIHSQENLDYLREGIYDMLSSRIAGEGKIIVVERPAVEKAFYEERPMRLDEIVAKRIGMKVSADYIVLGSLTKIGDYISLDARLISITEDKPPLGAFTQQKGIEETMLKIGEFAEDISYKITGRRATPSRPPTSAHPYLVPPKKELGRFDPSGLGFSKSQSFPLEIKGLDIGDVDGDKKNELVMMDQHTLYIFSYDGEKLKLKLKIEQGNEHNFLTLDVADVNRNGIAEIIVTSVVVDNLQSFILEYEDGKFKKVAEDEDWYFRVLDHPKEGPLLIGQRMSTEGTVLSGGPIYRFVWKKNSFERGPKMPVPKEASIFGLAVADIRSQGTYDYVILEEAEQRLNVISADGKISWRSKKLYGGTNNFYDTKKKAYTNWGYKDKETVEWRVFIPGRILVKDLDGDGTKEVIVNANRRSSSLTDRNRTFDTSEICSLVWQEGMLDTHWKTREINGYVPDFQVKDVDNDGNEELVAAVVQQGTITEKVTSNISFFKLY
jgi:TolB-like protein